MYVYVHTNIRRHGYANHCSSSACRRLRQLSCHVGTCFLHPDRSLWQARWDLRWHCYPAELLCTSQNYATSPWVQSAGLFANGLRGVCLGVSSCRRFPTRLRQARLRVGDFGLCYLQPCRMKLEGPTRPPKNCCHNMPGTPDPRRGYTFLQSSSILCTNFHTGLSTCREIGRTVRVMLPPS